MHLSAENFCDVFFNKPNFKLYECTKLTNSLIEAPNKLHDAADERFRRGELRWNRL